jgi:Mycothiol maleylpyruvate isomerase N-terminal domain.
MKSTAVQHAADTMLKHRQQFEEFCRSLSEEELNRPVPNSTWTVKDFIIHLSQFDEEVTRWMVALKDGRIEAPGLNDDGSTFDVDAYNNRRVAERHDWPLERILAEGAANRARLAEVMEMLEDAHIEQTVHFPGDNKRPSADVQFKLFLVGLARHDPIHVADMLKALPEHASDPEIAAWMDDGAVKWYQQAMSGPPRPSRTSG